MADLFTIGEETFTDDRWAITAMPSYRGTKRLKKYTLASGKPKSVYEGREATQRTMSVVYIPSQNLRTGALWEPRNYPAGANWLTELRRLELLNEIEEPLEVTIGEVDYGQWWVEIRTTPEPDTNLKNPTQGTIAPLITRAEITLTEVDPILTRLTNNAAGTGAALG